MTTEIREIPEEKKWAEGLTQEQFVHEFMNRNPRADSIPAVDEWIIKPMDVYHGINAPLPDQMEADDETAWALEKLEKEKEEKKEVHHVCRGCGKDCGVGPKMRLGWFNHEKHCKLMQNVKV